MLSIRIHARDLASLSSGLNLELAVGPAKGSTRLYKGDVGRKQQLVESFCKVFTGALLACMQPRKVYRRIMMEPHDPMRCTCTGLEIH